MSDILSGLSTSTYNAVKPVAQEYGVPDLVWETIAIMESNGNPNAVNSSSQATGLFQLMPNGGQADAAIRAGHSLNDLKDPGLNAQYAMPQIASAYNAIKSDASFPSGTWWIRLASLSGHPYENGDTGNSYVQQCGLKMKTISEGIATSTLSAGYSKAWAATGNVGPITQAVDSAVAGGIAVGAPVLQTGIDATSALTSAFTVFTSAGTWTRIGIFTIAMILVIVGFFVIIPGGKHEQ